ncbi:MAG: ComF family protein [Rhodobiaceae bacterium]|nr:ComF family protein [Rhodobiaceae bacterium]MCC0013754.1 ComF family protein [Rhodobiaceae bacterium]MCC0018590.1 ComF family protein [Rhodobiaceae bacterium]MCC0062184.1 ComF family protein [Rhodobiaceae bacterium]
MTIADHGHKGRLQRVGGMIADMLLPPLCLGCGEAVVSHGGVCASCWSGLTFIERPVCPVFGTPLPPGSPDGTLSAAAIAAPPPFKRLRAPCRYDRTARRLVTAFKYGDRLESASLLTRLMVRAGSECIAESDICVPVPLHWSRMLVRRYNQAAEMSRAITAETGLQYVPHALRRIRATRHQVGLKQAERALNVTGAFSVPAHARHQILGKRVLLIDDVYTTGATVTAAARALRRFGAGEVNVLVFARVLDEV